MASTWQADAGAARLPGALQGNVIVTTMTKQATGIVHMFDRVGEKVARTGGLSAAHHTSSYP
jgi:hypothetical protein